MAPATKVVVRLTDEPRDALGRVVHTGTHPAAMRRRARIRLSADADGDDVGTDEEIADRLATSHTTVTRVRQPFVAEGLDATLYREEPTGRPFRRRDGKQEAQLIALAGSKAPEGRAKWTATLLAGRRVELDVVESIDPAAVWRTPQKTTSSRGSSRRGSSHRRRTRPS